MVISLGDDITTVLKTVQQTLFALRDEHEAATRILEANLINSDSSEPSLPSEKMGLIDESLGKVMDGGDEASLLIMMDKLMQSYDVQLSKNHESIRLLRQENTWLLDELTTTQRKLQESERTVAHLEEERDHYKFQDSMNYLNSDFQHTTSVDATPMMVDTLQELGFGPEEEDQNNNQADQGCRSSSFSNPISNDYQLPTRLQTLQNLVIQYMEQGRFEVAIPLCKQALEDVVKVHGNVHLDVATMLNVLAIVYRNQENFKDAAIYLEKALSIRVQCCGENHHSVAATLNNLAIAYGKRGKYKESEPLCKRALEIRKNLLGPNHPDVAKQLTNLGIVTQQLEKYEETENYFKQALSIYNRAFPENHQNVIKTKNQLASVFLKQGKYQEAEEMYKNILSKVAITGNKPIWRIAEDREERQRNGIPKVDDESFNVNPTTVMDSNVMSTIKNLAAVYRKQGKEEAAGTLEEALGAKKQINGGADHTNSTASSVETSSAVAINPAQSGIKKRIMHFVGLNF
ncbi:Kinesin light chain [Caenorhabditis elegans]|nr:Kinesin light chain [Caenorhabditis elegans]CAA92746.2 Kinesin light chain [Caenorhabditis elegans]|eukprot:NP_001255535.1 Kinesin Light Chain [Caenorhabditis elegans]